MYSMVPEKKSNYLRARITTLLLAAPTHLIVTWSPFLTTGPLKSLATTWPYLWPFTYSLVLRVSATLFLAQPSGPRYCCPHCLIHGNSSRLLSLFTFPWFVSYCYAKCIFTGLHSDYGVNTTLPTLSASAFFLFVICNYIGLYFLAFYGNEWLARNILSWVHFLGTRIKLKTSGKSRSQFGWNDVEIMTILWVPFCWRRRWSTVCKVNFPGHQQASPED
jgi:hypothetical protein